MPVTIGLNTYPYMQNGVPYREDRYDSPIENFSQNESATARTFYVPWDRKADVSTAFLGRSYIASTTMLRPPAMTPVTVRFIARDIPHQHPHYPQFLWADKVLNMKGSVPSIGSNAGADDTGVGVSEEAKFGLMYTSPMYFIYNDRDLILAQLAENWSAGAPIYDADGVTTLLPDPASQFPSGPPDEASLIRYIAMKFNPTNIYQTLPTVKPLRFCVRKTIGEPAVVTSKAVVLLPAGDLYIRWEHVPIAALNITAINNVCGKTNRAAFGGSFTTLGVTWPAETLVATMPQIELERRGNGDFNYNITWKMRYYPKGANRFWTWRSFPDVYTNRVTDPQFGGDPDPASGPGFYYATFDGLAPVTWADRLTGVSDNRLFPLADYNKMFRPPQ